MSSEERPIGTLADRIAETARNESAITVGDIADTLGSRSHYALLLCVAGAAATPLSGIPGVSSACGVMIAILALERLLLNRDIYLPGKLRRRSIDADRVQQTIEKIRPLIRWIDRRARHRLQFLFHRPMIYLLMVICVISGLTMPFLEFIPFSGSVVATGVALIAVALVTRDGLVALLALVPYAALVALVLRAT